MDKILRKKPKRKWEWREYQQGCLIENGIALNKTGTFVWKLCDGKKTVAEVVNRLVKEYDVEEKRAREDVAKLINLLKKEKALELL